MGVYEELLVSDFEQCFEQMRHYDDIFRQTLQFGFGGLVTVIAASAALIGQYGVTHLITTAVAIMLLLSGVAGVLLVISLARNRVYFAIVARYVNEVRAAYLAHSPGGVSNIAGIYADPGRPKLFNPGSTHSIQLYLLSACNSILLAGGALALLAAWELASSVSPNVDWQTGTLAFSLCTVFQISWALLYWTLKSTQSSGDAAVSGKAA